MFLRIPIAHLHGGEASEGAVDESIRHAITKMSSLHFVAASAYRARVLQMGEDPATVFLFGTPGLDVLTRAKLADRDAIEKDVGLSLRSPSFLVTYHPATLGAKRAVAAIEELFAALDQFPKANVLVTRANADAEGRAINVAIDAWASTRASRAVVHTSLGQLRYLAVMRCVDVVIGNSSSGLIEAPALRVPTVNIGPRQDGRLKAASIIDCDESATAIARAIERARTPEHAETIRGMSPPYGDARGASTRIKEVLKTHRLDGIERKRFHDVALQEDPRGR
jgi:UDP-N-acetylglucosamine 2-epimerase (non-hydrolysing)/GDP/UDP-N,N'-diacetylbacillosamine 2-epimerase (hydrolysing)